MITSFPRTKCYPTQVLLQLVNPNSDKLRSRDDRDCHKQHFLESRTLLVTPDKLQFCQRQNSMLLPAALMLKQCYRLDGVYEINAQDCNRLLKRQNNAENVRRHRTW